MQTATQSRQPAAVADSSMPSGIPAAWFVAAATVAICVSTMVYVSCNAFTSPCFDEWRWVTVTVGSEPVTPEWLWQLENGHCFPLSKLMYLGVAWATGIDFRAIAIFSSLLLTMMAAVMTLAVARTRGKCSALDVLIPVICLNWGHYMSLLWGFELGYIMPIVLIFTLLLLVSQRGERLTVVRALSASACAVAAALCGAAGMFFLPAVSVWLVVAGLRRWSDSRPACVTILILAATALLPLEAYLNVASIVHHDAEGGHLAASTVVHGALQFLSMSLGKFGGETHPLSGILVVTLAVVAAARLVQVWRLQPAERVRAAGLASFLCGGLGMALGIGASRGWIGCLQTRYSLLGAPLILCLYLIGSYFGPRIRPVLLHRACAAGLVVLVVLYDVKGMRLAHDMLWNVLRMEASVREGLPVEAVAVRHWEEVQALSPEYLQRCLGALHGKGVGPYRGGVAPEKPRDIAVHAMLPLQMPGSEQPLKSLRSDEEIIQPFVAANDGALFRIDVEAHPLRCASGRLLWSVDEIDATGQRRQRASGEVPLVQWGDPAYAGLAFDPFTPAPGSRCELRLCPQGAAVPLLGVAQYATSGQAAGEVGMRAFVYYERLAGP
jgi:hypothetical protein